ncbi:MAG: cobyrinate a,c-diamide synthase [Deltaproteobacteria bacterium]|nr:cobyrinate a,c-diamide synthase [Deltaproteobacteria bacterium]
MEFPRLVVAALRGGSGKTILSMGIILALKAQGLSIAPFKKGPDYIDAGWLSLAAGRSCYNLDNYLVDTPRILHSFHAHTHPGDIAVIEGNRGLFDSSDLAGTTATAELAKLIKAPVLLSLDCTKSTRTMAALVSGCIEFDDEVDICGVILNRVAGSRHESILRQNIEHYCGVPILGVVPKLGKQYFPERHMGLVPTAEHQWAMDSLDAVLNMANNYLDLKAILSIAETAPSLDVPDRPKSQISLTVHPANHQAGSKPRIGIIKDAAFQFYYPENLDALVAAGAETVYLSPLSQTRFPELDALYIGGGFPETHARELSENCLFRQAIYSQVQFGLPVYAECGGLMYLGNILELKGKSYPMCGVLPIVFGFTERPQGHGYTQVTVTGDNPFYPVGTTLRGHEFHYSYLKKWDGDAADLVFQMTRGTGLTDKMDGVCFKNVLATYTHIHALGTPQWAEALVGQAAAHRDRRAHP